MILWEELRLSVYCVYLWSLSVLYLFQLFKLSFYGYDTDGCSRSMPPHLWVWHLKSCTIMLCNKEANTTSITEVGDPWEGWLGPHWVCRCLSSLLSISLSLHLLSLFPFIFAYSTYIYIKKDVLIVNELIKLSFCKNTDDVSVFFGNNVSSCLFIYWSKKPHHHFHINIM